MKIINNKYFILTYRIAAFVISLCGILSHIGMFSGGADIKVLLTYTVQSNILVCGVFFILSLRTIYSIRSGEEKTDHGFYPPLSFAAMIDILLTMLIFWVVLAPTNWAGLKLYSVDNLTVHMITPMMIFADRIMFYADAYMKKREILYAVIFPYIYILESFINGRFKIVMFPNVGGGSYYLYPFLNFDRLGWMVFVYVILLTLFFLFIGNLFLKWEHKRHAEQK